MTFSFNGFDPAMIGFIFMVGIAYFVLSAMTGTRNSGEKSTNNSGELGKILLYGAILFALVMFTSNNQNTRIEYTPNGVQIQPNAPDKPVQPLFPEQQDSSSDPLIPNAGDQGQG